MAWLVLFTTSAAMLVRMMLYDHYPAVNDVTNSSLAITPLEYSSEDIDVAQECFGFENLVAWIAYYPMVKFRDDFSFFLLHSEMRNHSMMDYSNRNIVPYSPTTVPSVSFFYEWRPFGYAVVVVVAILAVCSRVFRAISNRRNTRCDSFMECPNTFHVEPDLPSEHLSIPVPNATGPGTMVVPHGVVVSKDFLEHRLQVEQCHLERTLLPTLVRPLVREQFQKLWKEEIERIVAMNQVMVEAHQAFERFTIQQRNEKRRAMETLTELETLTEDSQPDLDPNSPQSLPTSQAIELEPKQPLTGKKRPRQSCTLENQIGDCSSESGNLDSD